VFCISGFDYAASAVECGTLFLVSSPKFPSAGLIPEKGDRVAWGNLSPRGGEPRPYTKATASYRTPQALCGGNFSRAQARKIPRFLPHLLSGWMGKFVAGLVGAKPPKKNW
jgi:hypothetical protein